MADLPKLTQSRERWTDVYSGIIAGLKLTEVLHEFKYALVRNRHKLFTFFKEVEGRLKEFDEDRKRLAIEHCDKDKDGKPLTEKTQQGDRYTGLVLGMKPEYDIKNKALNDELLAYLAEAVELPYYQIRAEHINDKVPGNVLDLIYPITEDKGA